MANFKVAKRYAKGLYDYSESVQKTDEVYSEMKNLTEVLQGNKELKQFFKSPILDFKKKQTIAQEIFKNYSDTTQKFIHLVIGQKREANLQEIAQQFQAFTDVKKGIQKAIFTSATELNDATVNQILTKSNLINDIGNTNLEKRIDTSIIGGYILRVADQQIDASVKTQFNKLRKQFDENQYISKI